MDAFMSLVKQMREAQRNKPFLQISGSVTAERLKKYQSEHEDYLKLLRALEKRVDEEIAAAERKPGDFGFIPDEDCIVMADGRKLVQGNLFE